MSTAHGGHAGLPAETSFGTRWAGPEQGADRSLGGGRLVHRATRHTEIQRCRSGRSTGRAGARTPAVLERSIWTGSATTRGNVPYCSRGYRGYGKKATDLRPWALRRAPMELEMMPFPTPEMTPPLTTTYFMCASVDAMVVGVWSCGRGSLCAPSHTKFFNGRGKTGLL